MTAAIARKKVLAATSHYQTLGVSPGASQEDIKLAHRKLARLLHPDLCKLKDAHDLCSRVNVAYMTLSDKELRRKYDFVEKTAAKVCATCAGTGHVKKQKGFKKVAVACPSCDGTGEV